LKIVGADYKYIVDSIDIHCGRNPDDEVESVSPFSFFPIVTYNKCSDVGDLSKVVDYCLKVNEKYKSENKDLVLDTEQIMNLKSIVSTLKDVTRYHATSFTQGEYDVLTKLSNWKIADRLPSLDISSTIVLLSGAADHFAESNNDHLSDDILSRAIGSVMDENVMKLMANCLLTWRFFAHCFIHSKLRNCIYENIDVILDTAETYIKHDNVKVKITVASTLLNACVAITEKKRCKQKKRYDGPLIKD